MASYYWQVPDWMWGWQPTVTSSDTGEYPAIPAYRPSGLPQKR